MNEIESLNELTLAANALSQKIEDITKIADPATKYSYSDLIMGILRAEYIYISEEAIKKHEDAVKGYQDATLHPWDLKTQYSPNTRAIFANSFGPWRAKEYFELDGSPQNPRIIWLLKEPYITKSEFKKGDRGGHNQVLDFFEWESLETPTHINIVKITKVFLERIAGKELSYKEAMSNICLLELNYFPGLAFKKTDSNNKLIEDWAKINQKVLHSLIKFYSPNIIIGSQEIMNSIVTTSSILNPEEPKNSLHLFNWLASRESFKEANFSEKYNCSIFNWLIMPTHNYRMSIFNRASKELWKNYTTCVKDQCNRLWVNCNYHPSCCDWVKIENESEFRILEFARWLNKNYNENMQ